MNTPPVSPRKIGILALVLAVPLQALAGRIDLPKWDSKQAAPGGFQLGGGLWPDAPLPGTDPAAEKLPPLPIPLPEGMSKSKPDNLEADEHKTIVIEDEEPQPKSIKEFRVPDKIDVLSLEEAPNFPPVAGELRDEYFALRPVEYLVDPQELLTEQKSNDVRRFLEYHAEEAQFDIYFLLFAESQEIPHEISIPQRHADWFGSDPVVTVIYFMGDPDRTEIQFSDELRSSLPEAVFQRIYRSCIREAEVGQNASDQVERLAIELSIRLYWMAKLLERQSAGETIASTEEELSEPWEMAGAQGGIDSVMIPQSRIQVIVERILGLPWAWIGSALGILLGGLFTGYLVWRRDSLSAKPILFPERTLPTRLGGEFSGGGFIGISFDVGGNNE